MPRPAAGRTIASMPDSNPGLVASRVFLVERY